MSDNPDNPFEELERKIRREADEKKSKEAIEGAKIRLITGKAKGGGGNPVSQTACVFFSTLLMKLKFEANYEKTKTMCTDGEYLWYNPEHTAKLADLDMTAGVLTHEVMHCALLHQARRESRDPAQWNLACDFVINQLIKEAGFKLLPDAPFAGEGQYAKLPKGKSEEEYYELLKQQKKGDGDDGSPSASDDGGGQEVSSPGQPGDSGGNAGDGDGGGSVPDPGRCGSVTEPQGNGSGKAKSAADWKVNVSQANQSAQQEALRGKGDTPGWMKRMVGEVTTPKVAWQDVLREFVTKTACNDYDWSRPNRRLMASAGVYLPRLHSHELGQVLVFVDTSGSIGPDMLDRFAAELQGILDDFATVELTIMYHDAQVYPDAMQTWSPDDGPLKLEPAGGGGTDHRPCFEWMKESNDAGIDPACVVFLTDMCSCFPPPEEQPDVPVLWCKVGKYQTPDPGFGQILEVE